MKWVLFRKIAIRIPNKSYSKESKIYYIGINVWIWVAFISGKPENVYLEEWEKCANFSVPQKITKNIITKFKI